jgi:N-terminal region of glycosyl transferase group 7/N-terminal domain of galactosyltransferase
MEEWTKAYSKTYKTDYWFNNKTGQRSWEKPLSSLTTEDKRELISNTKRSREGDDGGLLSAKKTSLPRIAVIVPYQDAHIEQKRRAQLDEFIPNMDTFLRQSGCDYRIFIIEQYIDDRKFNRGKLLNIGFDIACKDNYNIFIFHDVDLLPSIELLPYYSTLPSSPVHIARVWNRYNGNENYFGGIVAFSDKDFKAINGFPNEFWGWGGEDDALVKRVKEVSDLD